MPDALDALFAFLLAGILALLLVAVTDRVARRIGAIAYPDDQRSLHAVPTPRLGGLAIFVAVLVAALIWLPWDAETRSILVCAALITAVGMLDDVYVTNAATKTLGQVAAVIVPVSAGVTVDSFTVPFLGQLNPGSVELLGLPGGGAVDLGGVGTTLGLVAMINVINLIAGVDGLAAGVCLISGVALAVIALSLDRTAAGGGGGAHTRGAPVVLRPRRAP